MARWLVILAIVVGIGTARAEPIVDTVALSPFDADPSLELYGQPVAAQVAKTLKAAGIDVVILAGRNPKMPPGVRLAVNGKLEGDGREIVISVTVRDLGLGEQVDDAKSDPPVPLKKIDEAAADLANKLLPKLQKQIVVLHNQPKTSEPVRHPVEPMKTRKAVVAVGAVIGGVDAMRAALADAALGWARDHRRDPQTVEARSMAPNDAVKTVAKNDSNLGMLFEVQAFSVTPGEVPMAHARVRVRIVDASNILFDRVVFTDTIVGERKMSTEALASRTAREVLAIVAPFMRKKVSGW
jgi:hypothetical protein